MLCYSMHMTESSRPNRTATEYECQQCGERVRTETHPGTCPECGNTFQNIGVPREL
jgi:rubrerythrin